MDNPAITVVLTICDRPFNYIKEAVYGILNQTLKEFELYIINNSSKTNSELDDWINGLSDHRISYLRLEKHIDFCEEYARKIFL